MSWSWRSRPRPSRCWPRRATTPDFGARPLRRVIQNLIEDPLAEELLRGAFATGSKVIVDRAGDELDISTRAPVSA